MDNRKQMLQLLLNTLIFVRPLYPDTLRDGALRKVYAACLMLTCIGNVLPRYVKRGCSWRAHRRYDWWVDVLCGTRDWDEKDMGWHGWWRGDGSKPREKNNAHFFFRRCWGLWEIRLMGNWGFVSKYHILKTTGFKKSQVVSGDRRISVINSRINSLMVWSIPNAHGRWWNKAMNGNCETHRGHRSPPFLHFFGELWVG